MTEEETLLELKAVSEDGEIMAERLWAIIGNEPFTNIEDRLLRKATDEIAFCVSIIKDIMHRHKV